jgi:DNA-binding beta-propeller fold protein YncE
VKDAPLRLLASSVVAVLVVSGLLGLAGGSAGTPRVASLDTPPPLAPLALAPAGSTASAHPASVSIGGAERTLVLYNQTLFDYNASAIAGTVGEDPGLAYDTLNETGWAVGLSTVGASTVDVFDPATDVGLRQMVAGGQAAIAYDNRTNTMWVTGGDTFDNVTVFNASTYAVVRVVGTGGDPRAITYDWRTREMFVVDSGTANVTILNDSTYAASSLSPPVGEYAGGIAYDPSSGNLFVSHQLGQNITAFYQSGNAPHQDIAVPGAGQMGTIVDDPQNGMVYAVGDSPGVFIVDAATNSTAGTISLPHQTIDGYDGLAVDPVDHRLYVSQIAAGGYGNVVSYQPAPTASTSTSLTNTSTGFNAQPETLAYDGADARILVCDTNQFDEASSNITEISTASSHIVGSVAIQRLPLGAAYDPVTRAVYIYDGGSGEVYELNANDQILRSAFVGYTDDDTFDGVGISGQVAYDSVNQTIFVDWSTPDEPDGYGVAEFSASALTLVENWTTGLSGPAGLAYDTSDSSVYVANNDGYNVTVISLITGEEHWVGTGERPIGVAYDTKNYAVYVTSEYYNNVTVISGLTSGASIGTGVDSTPWGDVYDPSNGYVYVADYESGNLTVINGSTNRTAAPYSIDISGSVNGPAWLAYDSINETIVASLPGLVPSLPGYTGLALINATNATYFGTLEFGDELQGLAYDPAAESLFAVATFPGAVYQVSFGAGPTSPPPPLGARLGAEPSSISLGQSTDLVSSASGGTLPYTYTYSTLPQGCTGLNLSTLPCTPTASGTFYVGVNVTDPTGGSAAAVTVLVVTYTPATLQVGLTPNPASITLGRSLDLVATASGGTGSGTYTFAYSTLPTGCTSQNLSTLPCAPTTTGTFYVGVNVTDPAADHGSASTRFVVLVAPSIAATLSPQPAAFDLGNSTTLTVQVTGTPTGPVTFDFTALPTGCASANTSSLACTPTAVGTFPLTVEVRDSAGHFAEANSSLVVQKVPAGTTPGKTTPSNTGSNEWVWILIAIVVVIAVILIVVFAARRRRPPPPVQASPSASGPPPPAVPGPPSA